jgi:hypothetical protein
MLVAFLSWLLKEKSGTRKVSCPLSYKCGYKHCSFPLRLQVVRILHPCLVSPSLANTSCKRLYQGSDR